jgi:hypothetical protein
MDKAQHLQRIWSAIDQITNQPKTVIIAKVDALQKRF